MKVNYIYIDNSLIVSLMNRAIFNNCKLANYKGDDLEFTAALEKIAARSSGVVTVYCNLKNEPLFASDLCYNPYNIKVTSAGKKFDDMENRAPIAMTADKLNKALKTAVKEEVVDDIYNAPVFAYKDDHSVSIKGVGKDADMKGALILLTANAGETIKVADLMKDLNNSLKSNKVLVKIGKDYHEVMFLDDTMEKGLSLDLFANALQPVQPVAAAKEVELPGTNLVIKKLGMDTNGNHIITLAEPNKRGFSIQTNGNLPKTHNMSGYKPKELSKEQLETIAKEVKAYQDKLNAMPVAKAYTYHPEDVAMEHVLRAYIAKKFGKDEIAKKHMDFAMDHFSNDPKNKIVRKDIENMVADGKELFHDFVDEDTKESDLECMNVAPTAFEGMPEDMEIGQGEFGVAESAFRPYLNEMIPKPRNLEYIIDSDKQMAITPEIEALPKFKEEEVYFGLDRDWTIGDDFESESPMDGRIFIMETKKGDILVDTQGYNYPRYAVKLVNDSVAAEYPGDPNWAPIVKLIDGGMGIMEALEAEFGQETDEVMDELYEDFLTANPKYMQDEIEKEALSAVGKDGKMRIVLEEGDDADIITTNIELEFDLGNSTNKFFNEHEENLYTVVVNIMDEEVPFVVEKKGDEIIIINENDRKEVLLAKHNTGFNAESTAGNAPVVHNEVLLKGKEPSFANPGWRASTYTLKVYELPTLDHVAGRDKTVCYKAEITYDSGYPDGSGIRDVLNKGRIDTPFVGVKTKEEAVKLAKESFKKMNIVEASENSIVKQIMDSLLTKKVIKEAIKYNHNRSWVFDNVESLICEIDDTTEEGAETFDELEVAIDKALGLSTAVHPSEKGQQEIKLRKVSPQHLEKLAEYANTGILKHAIFSELKPDQAESVKKALIAVGNRNLGHDRTREEGKEGVIAGTDIPEFAVWVSSDCMGETADYLNDNIGDKNAKDTYAFAFERFEKCLLEFYKTEMNKSNFGDKLKFWENLIYDKRALGAFDPSYVDPEHKLADEQNSNLSHEEYNCKAICDIYPCEETVKFYSLNASEPLTKCGDHGRCYLRCNLPCVLVDGVEFCYESEKEFLKQWEMLPELKFLDVTEIVETIGDQMPAFLEQKPDLTEAKLKKKV